MTEDNPVGDSFLELRRPSQQDPKTKSKYEEQRNVAALMGCKVAERIDRNYSDALSSYIRDILEASSESPDSEFLSNLKLIRSPLARQCLELIWIETCFDSDFDLELAGITRRFQRGSLNCNSLAAELAKQFLGDGSERFRSSQQLAQKVRSIISSAVFFGLVVKRKKVGKSEPLLGTRQLHTLLSGVHIRNTSLINRLSQAANSGKGGAKQ